MLQLLGAVLACSKACRDGQIEPLSQHTTPCAVVFPNSMGCLARILTKLQRMTTGEVVLPRSMAHGGREIPAMVHQMNPGGVRAANSQARNAEQIRRAGVGETRAKDKDIADGLLAGGHRHKTGSKLNGGDVRTSWENQPGYVPS